ncbi:MAG TPA: GlsB/YeaQ/YmgE family stress response membrane protein [Gemmatimonadales bacterium]|nr:GlsB/YeaQ/YmgE family stress response membrane protein [Gemmatimonadales bacterium]
MTNLLWTLLIGGAAGWLAGKLTNGKGYGLFANIVLGIVGGVLGGWLFGLIGLAAYGLVGRIVMATVGACLLVWIAKKIAK